MGMCKSCGEVFNTTNMEDGFCKECIANNKNRLSKENKEDCKSSFVILENKDKNNIKKIPLGMSWTTLFFWFFVPLLRGDLVSFLFMLLISGFLFITLTETIIGSIVSLIIMLIISFTYNGRYIKKLLKKGFMPKNKCYEELLKRQGLL